VAGGCGEIRGVSLDGDTLSDVREMPFILENLVSITATGKRKVTRTRYPEQQQQVGQV
jgi:hypothetical protein